MQRSLSQNNQPSQDSPHLGELVWTALALTGLLLIGAPAARAESGTSVQVRFSGVVHAPCYGWHDFQGADCELSRREESVSFEEEGVEQPSSIQAATHVEAETLEEMAQPSLVRQPDHAYRRITLTPS